MKHGRQIRDKKFEKLIFDAIEALPKESQTQLNQRIEDDPSGEYLSGLISQVLTQAAAATGKCLVDALEFPKLIKQRAKDHRKFNKHLQQYWGQALECLECMVHGFWEYGVVFYTEMKARPELEEDPFFIATVRIQARGSRIANEILTLLKNGLSDGAMARWRTLYELSVIANFISDHGEETAGRYLAHEEFQSIKHAEDFHQQEIRIQGEPLTDDELEEISKRKAYLLELYGPDFGSDYGWAANVLNLRRPTFAHIESAIDLSTVRPLYRRASADIHGGADGLTGSGTIPGYEDQLVAGASTAGLGEPGVLTANAITFLSTVPLVCCPTVDRLVWVSAFREMADQCIQAFNEAEERLYEDEGLLYEACSV